MIWSWVVGLKAEVVPLTETFLVSSGAMLELWVMGAEAWFGSCGGMVVVLYGSSGCGSLFGFMQVPAGARVHRPLWAFHMLWDRCM